MEEGDCDGMFLLIDIEHTAKPTGALISNSYVPTNCTKWKRFNRGHNATLSFLEEALLEYGLTSTTVPLTGTTVCSLRVPGTVVLNFSRSSRSFASSSCSLKVTKQNVCILMVLVDCELVHVHTQGEVDGFEQPPSSSKRGHHHYSTFIYYIHVTKVYMYDMYIHVRTFSND